MPLAKLLSLPYTAAIRSRLRATGVVPASTYGNGALGSDGGTSHISVIDAGGNAVACTTSINTAFGSKVGLPGRGIVLNNTMDDFSLQHGVANYYGLVGSEANAIEAGKRPLSSMSPTVVIEDGRARMALGGSGGPLIITATLQTLLNALEFSMDVGAAVAAPRIHNQWMPDRVKLESSIPEVVGLSLKRLGHNIVPIQGGAAVQAVEVVVGGSGGGGGGGARRVRAASDERKGGAALAQ